MKSHLPLLAIAFSLVLGCRGALAQSAPAPTPASTQPAAPKGDALTSDEKQRIAKAHEQALADNPDLKAEKDALTQEGQSLKSGDASQEDKMAFMEKLKAHQQKMKAAMIKVDPTIGPLLDKMEAQMKQRFQQRAKTDGGSA